MAKSEEELLRLVLEAWYPSPIMKSLSLKEMSPEDIERARRVAKAIEAHTATVAAEAETNAVAWAIGVIDDLHFNPSGVNDLMDIDQTYKGIKNALRDRYKARTGVDPAPNYPIKKA